MASARDIRRRIKGVRSTGKITRAMEMISGVKVRKAVQAVTDIRPYAREAIRILGHLDRAARHERHPLLVERPVRNILYVVIASNRGLCGAFNAQIMKKLRRACGEDDDCGHLFLTIGRKADAAARRMLAGPDGGQEGGIVASFPDVLGAPSPELMRPIARVIIDEYERGRVDRVVMVYTDYVSMLLQEVKLRVLLPVVIKDVRKAMHETGQEGTSDKAQGASDGRGEISAEYVIEPSPRKVLWRMIPRLLEMELYHAVLESNASQESARMVAMKNATDAAKEMVGDLTLAYNQVRQSKITAEIAELSAGKAALET